VKLSTFIHNLLRFCRNLLQQPIKSRLKNRPVRAPGLQKWVFQVIFAGRVPHTAFFLYLNGRLTPDGQGFTLAKLHPPRGGRGERRLDYETPRHGFAP
jgi:hypothetical protein